jgi:arginyl-tRNA synthetase
VSPDWLARELEGMVTGGTAAWAPAVPGGYGKVVVDFSSPNIAKVRGRSRPEASKTFVRP